MTMSYQTPSFETLEPRLLLTTLVGGDVFEYMDENEQWYRISLDGDIIIELIGDRINDDYQPIFGDLAGEILDSPTGATHPYDQAVQVIGSISTFSADPDDFAVNALASADGYGNGDTYGFSVATENDVLRIRLLKITPQEPLLNSVTTESIIQLQGGVLGNDNVATSGVAFAGTPMGFVANPDTGQGYASQDGLLHPIGLVSGVVGAGVQMADGALNNVTDVTAMGWRRAGDASDGLYVVGTYTGSIQLCYVPDPSTGVVASASPIVVPVGSTDTFLGCVGIAFDPGDAVVSGEMFAYAVMRVQPVDGDPFYALYQLNTGGSTSLINKVTFDGDADLATIRALAWTGLPDEAETLVAIETSHDDGPRLVTIGTGNGLATPISNPGTVVSPYNLGSYDTTGNGDYILCATSTSTLYRGTALHLETDDEGASLVEAIYAADFCPTTNDPDLDGLLFFVVRWDNGGTPTDTLYSIDVTRPTDAEIQSSLRSWGLIQTSDDRTVTSIAWELSNSGATATLYAHRNNADTSSILDVTPTAVRATITSLGPSTEVWSITSRGEAVMDITSIEFTDDDTAAAETSMVAVRSAGRDSTLVAIDLNDGTCLTLRDLPLPEPVSGDPVAGEDIQGLAWNPLLVSPFTGEYGVLLGTDAGTDQLVMIDYGFRANNLFAIYVSQSSSDSSISIAAVPDKEQDVRPMLPFEGSVGQLRINEAQGGDLILISAPGGTGVLYLGDRTPDINPDVDNDDLVPVLSGLLDRELGIRAKNVDDFLTAHDLSAGMVLDLSLLSYVSQEPDLVDRLLGSDFGQVSEIAVQRDGTIVAVDVSGITDQIAFVDPVSGLVTGAPQPIYDTTTKQNLSHIQGLDYGNHDPASAMTTGWMPATGVQQLFAVYDLTDPLPSTTIGGDLDGDYTIEGLTVTKGGAMYAVVNDAGTLKLYRINRDVTTGAILAAPDGMEELGEIVAWNSTALVYQAITEISDMEADPITGELYIVGVDPDTGDQTLYTVSTSPQDLIIGGGNEVYAASIGALDTGVLIAGDTVKALAMELDGSTRTLYGVIDTGAGDTLYTIGYTSGAATPLGTIEAPNGTPTDVQSMDFLWKNGQCLQLTAIDAAAGGRIIVIDITDPDESTVLGAIDTTVFSGYACDRAGIFYSVNNMGVANDQVWESPGEVAILGTLDAATGFFTRVGALQDAGGTEILEGIKTMAFRGGPSSLQAQRDALYVVDTDDNLWEVDPATGTIVSTDYSLSIDIESMDFDANKNLFGFYKDGGQLVDIGLTPLQPYGSATGSLTVGAVVATNVGSLRPTIGAISYDLTNDRFLTVDNAIGATVHGGTATSVLMALKGTTSNSATAQNIANVLLGGAVTGKVNISGNVDDTFYAGWLITGETNGQLEISPYVIDNFFVGGDLRNLVVNTAIGTLDGTTLDAPVYCTGFDLEVTGKVGQVWTLDSFVGSTHTENRDNYLIPHDAAATFQNEIEEKPDPAIQNPEGVLFQDFELYRADGAFFNDTFATAQYLGNMGISTGLNEGVIQLSGWLLGEWDDELDFYGVSLLAGQTITVQCTNKGTNIYVGVLDPDGRVVATDASMVDGGTVYEEEFRFTTDRPGVYRFAIGPAPFDGEGDVSGFSNYTLYITNTGNLALGAVKANNSIFGQSLDTSHEVTRGDLGAISAGTCIIFDVVTDNIVLSDGNLRTLEAASIGYLNEGTYSLWPQISVPNGDVGLVRASGTGENDWLGLWTNDAIGGNFQLIDAAVNFCGDLFANGGLGVLRAGNMADVSNYAPIITLNMDGVGNDGIIDLIDVVGNLGNINVGGPQIDCGPNGDVRYIRVGGDIVQDVDFGRGEYNGVTLNPGQSAPIDDDSGGTLTITPVYLTTNGDGDYFDPTTWGTPATDRLPVLTYRTYGIRGSGGSVLVDVASTGGFTVSSNSHGVGSPVQIGRITANGVGRATILTHNNGVDDVVLTPSPSVAYSTDLNVTINGSAANPIDVFEIIGGNFSTIINRTGGEIVSIIADSINNLSSLGSIGVPSNSFGVAVNPREDLVSTHDFIPAGYPFVQQHTGIIVNGHVDRILSRGAIGNVMVNGQVDSICANYSQPIEINDGQFLGLAAPIFTTGDILAVNIGEGIAPSGSGEFAHAGLFSLGEIGSVIGRGLGADIRGSIVGQLGVRNISLANGSIINADIIAGQLDSAIEYTSMVLSGDVTKVALNGVGGIIGSLISGHNVGNITVKNGFGMFNSDVITVDGNGCVGNTTVDGFGIRLVEYSVGGDQGNITARGRGALDSTRDYSPTVRYSETQTWLPGTNQRLSRLNDIHDFLGTSAADPLDRQGMLVDIYAHGNGNLGAVSGYRITTRRLGSGGTRFDFANSIKGFTTYPIEASDTATNSIDMVEVTTGELGYFNPAQDVNNLDMTVAGQISTMTIRGSLLGTSSISAVGPNGNIRSLTVMGQMQGNVTSDGIIGTITVGGDMTGNIVVAPIQPVRTALNRLTITGSYYGAFDVNGNVGTIDVGANMGVTGDTLRINGNLSRLSTGRLSSATDPNTDMALDLNVLGNVTSMMVYGEMSGDVWIDGNLRTLSVSMTDALDTIDGDLTVMGTLTRATITGGDWNSAMIGGDGIGSVNITNADLSATASITSLLGNISMVYVRNGDLLGTVSAPNGTIGRIIVTGSDLGPASLIEAGQLTLLQIDGDILSGARIIVDDELRTLNVRGNVEAGSTITAGSICVLSVGQNLEGDFAIGYGAQGTFVRVTGDLGSAGSVFSSDSDVRMFVRSILDGATVSVTRNLTYLRATGDIDGNVIVDGSITTLMAANLHGAVIVSGMDMNTVRITGVVNNSLIQAGINRGDDGDYVTNDENGSQIARMGQIKRLQVGSATLSIIAAGGHITSAAVSGNLTNSSISSGMVIDPTQIATVLDGTNTMAIVGDLNDLRGANLAGTPVILLWGNFGTASVRGTMNNSALSAGVDPGADGVFDAVAGGDTVSTSRTGGNSSVRSVTVTGTAGASIVTTDDGIGRQRLPVGLNTRQVDYTIDAIAGGDPMEAVIETVSQAVPQPAPIAGITVEVFGAGQVEIRHDGGSGAGIDTLAISGTDSRTRIVITGGGSIGRIITEDDTVVGTITYDGTLFGNGNALWLDAGPIRTFTLGTLDGAVRGGRIGADVTTLTLGAQGSGELRVGGSVNTLQITTGEDPLLHPEGEVLANTTPTAIAVANGPGTTWVFDVDDMQIQRWDITADENPGVNPVPGSSISVYSYLNADPADTSAPRLVTAMDMNFGGVDLMAVANVWSLSPTVTTGAIGNSTLSLNDLAVLANGNTYAIENANMTALPWDLGPDVANYDTVATAIDQNGTQYVIRHDTINDEYLLYYVNADTHELVPIGTDEIWVGGTKIVNIHAVDVLYDSVLLTNNLYFVGELDGSGQMSLYTLDVSDPTTATNDAVLVGALDGGGFADDILALCFTQDESVLYAIRDTGVDTLSRITLAGVTTDIGAVQVDAVASDIVGMDIDAAGNILALDQAGAENKIIRIDLITPTQSWAVGDDETILATADGLTSTATGEFYTVDANGVGNDRFLHSLGRDRLVQINTSTGVRTPEGYLRDIYGNYFYSDVYTMAGDDGNVLYAILKDGDGMGGAWDPTDGTAIARIATTASGGAVRVSSPTSNVNPPVFLDGGSVDDEFTAMAVNAADSMYVIRRVAGDDHLYEVDTAGTLTLEGAVLINGAPNTLIAGMGFDSLGNLVAYDVSGGAGLVNLSDPTLATHAPNPGGAQRITTADVLNPSIDAYAIGRTGADGYTAYGYDFDNVVGGMFYQSPGEVATVGVIDTNLAGDYGYFRQYMPLAKQADGTGLTSDVRDMSSVDATSVYIITADGNLYRYSNEGNLLADLGPVKDAATLENLSLTTFDYDTTEPAMIAIDGKYNQLVTLNTNEADFRAVGALNVDPNPAVDDQYFLDVTVASSGMMYAMRNDNGPLPGESYVLYRVARDAAGNVLGAQAVGGEFQDGGNTILGVQSIEADPASTSGLMFFIGRVGVAGTQQALYTVDTAGTVTKIADMTLLGAEFQYDVKALSFSGETLYFVANDGAADILYCVNTGSGEVTEMLDPTLASGAIEVGAVPVTMKGMDSGSDGVLLGFGTIAGSDYVIQIDVRNPGASINLSLADPIAPALDYKGFAFDTNNRFFMVMPVAGEDDQLVRSYASTTLPRMEPGSVDAADLTDLSYDSVVNNRFYTFSRSLATNGAFAYLNGTVQAEQFGLTLCGVSRLSLGDGYAGRIIATGNTFRSVTVTGDFEGTLYTAGQIQRYTQTGDFIGTLYGRDSLGSITIRGDLLDGGLISTPGALASLQVTGSMNGDFSVGQSRRLTFGVVGATADVRVSTAAGSVQVTGTFSGAMELGSVSTFMTGNLNTVGAVSANVQIHGNAGTIRLNGGTDAGTYLKVDGSVRSLLSYETHNGVIAVDEGATVVQLTTVANAFVVIGQNVRVLTVTGNVTSSVLSIGTTIGADGVYNTSDDRITGGVLQTATLRGNILNSALVAGVLPSLSYGPGLPVEMWYYTGDDDAAMNQIDTAEVGGVLPSAINRLSIFGTTGTVAGGNASAVASETIGTITLRNPWSNLYTREYSDPINPPAVDWSRIERVSDSEVKIYFTEEVNTSMLILSVDTDDDGSVTGMTDVQGTITITDEDTGEILDDVTLSYTKETDENGRVHGVLHIFKANLFDDYEDDGFTPIGQHISVVLSGSLTPNSPAIIGLSGLRSARRDLVVTTAPMGTIFDGNNNGAEGGDATVYFGQFDLRTSVPEYTWWYGCTPTSAGMIMGYHDANGFGDLIVGDASTQTDDVNAAIASSGNGIYTQGSGPNLADTPATPGTGHIGDYALYVPTGTDYMDSNDYDDATPIPDLSDPEVRALVGVTPHAGNCLADFIMTSWSDIGLTMGGSWPAYIGAGMTDYVDWVSGGAYSSQATSMDYGVREFNLGVLAGEIANGRPVLINVDSSGNGRLDHSMVAIGYDFLTGRYVCYTTWGFGVMEYDFTAVEFGVKFGVDSGVLFQITNAA